MDGKGRPTEHYPTYRCPEVLHGEAIYRTCDSCQTWCKLYIFINVIIYEVLHHIVGKNLRKQWRYRRT